MNSAFPDGRLSGPEKPAIYFPRGLPGLEQYRWYEMEQVPENPFFLMMHSREESAVGMILLDPFPLFPDYRCQLNASDREDLELNLNQHPLIYTTISFWKESMFTNLASPLVLNTARRRGKQIYLQEYSGQLRVCVKPQKDFSSQAKRAQEC